MAIQVGQQLGNYRLIRLLGSGSFGEVYLGENILIGTQVAIKVLHGNFSPQAIQDFKNEALTIGRLKHPNIVPLLDFGEHAGEFYMIMEYAANGTLEDRHSQGMPVPLVTVISYVKQIAEALQYAHDNKIVHRDIKPANIFVGQKNEIVVGDFGIAIIAHSTQTMQLQVPLGTPGYAAPEQAQGLARPASDQYALGIMVCEWLSGMSPPFPQGIKIPTISPAVEQVVFKALEKDPKQRYPRIQDFTDALEKASNPPLQQAAALPQNVVAPVQPVSPPIPQLQGLSPADRLYREGILAQSAGDLERAAFLWQQILQHNPYYQNGTLRLLFWELAPQRIKDKMRQARAAKTTGDWQREIDLWNEITDVLSRQSDPSYREAKQIRAVAEGCIRTARQNLQNKPLYEHAQQLLSNGNRNAAKKTLQMLWQQAPSYGDPSGLAKKAGTHVPLVDPYTKDELRSCLVLLSLGGMLISSFILIITLLLTLLSPVINWANNLIGYHQHVSYPGWLFVVLPITDIFFLVLYLFTRNWKGQKEH